MGRATLDEGLLERICTSVAAALAVDQAVERIATGLPPELDVSRVGFRMRDVEHDFVIVVGVWSRKPTQLKAGVSYPIASSLGESFTSVARSRVCSIRVVGKDPIAPPVIQEMLAVEGNASAVLIPVPRGIDVPAVLAIFSGKADGFAPRDIPFFDRLGMELAPSLLAHAPLP
jgi:hypothetical protein